MLAVVFPLHLPPPDRLVDRAAHGIRHAVRVQDRLPAEVAGRPADRLHKRAVRAQEPLLVRVEDRDQRHLRQIKPLPQEVDPDENIERPQPQVPQDLDPVDGGDVGVHVAHAHAAHSEELRQILRHPLRERRHEHALAPFRPASNLAQQVIHLPAHRPHLDLRIEQARRADQLLHDDPLAPPQLVLARRRAHEDRARHEFLPFRERERPVVERGRQPKAELHQRLLAASVSLVHAADLGDRDVGLVHDDHVIAREIVEQAVGTLPGRAAVEVPAVVLDAGTEPHLRQHLEIEAGSLLQPLRLEEPALGAQVEQARLHLDVDRLARPFQPVARRGVVRGRKDRGLGQPRDRRPRHGIDLRDALDDITPQLDPHPLLLVGRQDLDDVAPHPKGAAHEVQVVAGILYLHEARENLAARNLLPLAECEHQIPVAGRIAQSIDRGDRGDDDHVAPLHERGSRAQPQPVNVLVYRRILFDIGVRGRDVGFGLIVVIVGDEIFDRIARKELAQFAIQLRGQRLVVTHDERGTAHLGDHRGQRHGLPASRHAEQRLPLLAAAHPVRKVADRRGLVAHRRERQLKIEAGRRPVRATIQVSSHSRRTTPCVRPRGRPSRPAPGA